MKKNILKRPRAPTFPLELTTSSEGIKLGPHHTSPTNWFNPDSHTPQLFSYSTLFLYRVFRPSSGWLGEEKGYKSSHTIYKSGRMYCTKCTLYVQTLFRFTQGHWRDFVPLVFLCRNTRSVHLINRLKRFREDIRFCKYIVKSKYFAKSNKLVNNGHMQSYFTKCIRISKNIVALSLYQELLQTDIFRFVFPSWIKLFSCC